MEHKTKIIITFGAFLFEFSRRVYEIEPRKGPKHWSTSNLKEEFERSIEDIDINQTKIEYLYYAEWSRVVSS
jgi:hypothetical protein